MGETRGGDVARALILVDIQKDYFPGGRHPLERPEEAARQAARLLEAARKTGDEVVHVRHLWEAPDAAYLQAGTAGGDIHPLVAPLAGEPVVEKAHPNSFLATSLRDLLRE